MADHQIRAEMFGELFILIARGAHAAIARCQVGEQGGILHPDSRLVIVS